MRLAPPGAARREPQQVRIGHDRHAERRAQQIDGLVARRAGQVQRFELPLPLLVVHPRPKERAAVRLGQQGRHQVAPPVEIVHEHDQLPEPGLADVVREKLRVAPAEVGCARTRRRRGSAHDLPESSGEPVGGARRVERRPQELPPAAAPGPSAPARLQRGGGGSHCQNRQQREQHEGDEPRQVERQRAQAGRWPPPAGRTRTRPHRRRAARSSAG